MRTARLTVTIDVDADRWPGGQVNAPAADLLREVEARIREMIPPASAAWFGTGETWERRDGTARCRAEWSMSLRDGAKPHRFCWTCYGNLGAYIKATHVVRLKSGEDRSVCAPCGSRLAQNGELAPGSAACKVFA